MRLLNDRTTNPEQPHLLDLSPNKLLLLVQPGFSDTDGINPERVGLGVPFHSELSSILPGAGFLNGGTQWIILPSGTCGPDAETVDLTQS